MDRRWGGSGSDEVQQRQPVGLQVDLPNHPERGLEPRHDRVVHAKLDWHNHDPRLQDNQRLRPPLKSLQSHVSLRNQPFNYCAAVRSQLPLLQ